MIYRCKYFDILELIPPDLWEHHKHEPHKLWLLFDVRALITLDRLRKVYGPLVINDWHRGGALTLRGWRPANTSTGAVFSQHKFGRAFDLTPSSKSEATVDMIREDIRQDAALLRQNPTVLNTIAEYITCIEMGVPWIHFDTRNWLGPLLEINP